MKKVVLAFDIIALVFMGIAALAISYSYPAFSETVSFWYVCALPIIGIMFLIVSRTLWWLYDTAREIPFRDRSSLDAYLKRLVPAARKIDVANFTLAPPEDPDGEEYMKAVADRIRHDDKFKFRRLLTVPSKRKLDWIERTAIELVACPNFELKYVPESVEQEWLSQFMPTFLILDNDRLCAGFYYSNEGALNMFLDSKKVARQFANYFNYLWERSYYIKKPSSTENDVKSIIENLRKRFNAIRPSD